MLDASLEELRRAKAEAPDDLAAARRLAVALARAGDRDEATRAWQDVLAGSPGDREAEERLRSLGCELLLRERSGLVEVFESTRDGSSLVRTAALPHLFVGRIPVTYERFQRFLVRVTSGDGDAAPELAGLPRAQAATVFLSPRSPLRGNALMGFTLRGGASDHFVLDATWLGARAYARWAGGRLLREPEWELLARDPDGPVVGLDRLEGEWLDGTGGGRAGAGPSRPGTADLAVARPVRSLQGGTLWFPESAAPSVFFRYARDSWFDRSRSDPGDEPKASRLER